MFLFCLVFAMSLCASVYMCFVVTCWERADLLALICGVYCEFVTFPLISWVRCGTCLYRFLIFAPLLTLCLLCFRSRTFIDALWSPVGKGLTSWLSFVMSNCDVVTFPLVSCGMVWCLIASIPDLFTLSY